MFRHFCVFLFISISTISFGQAIDLCGIWFGYNYNCYELNATTGQITPYTLTEIIDIRQIGDTTYAVKITGDDCVTAGQITWKGIISDSQSTVFVTLGAPEAPNSSLIENPLIVVNSTYLDLTFTGLTFQKATCFQLDSLKNIGIPVESTCVSCEMVIPNVFSPNNDLTNDYFAFFLSKPEGFLTFQILNRWGEIVYQTNDSAISWDGKYNGNACSDGIYFWTLIYDTNKLENNKSGFLTLIR